MLAGQLSAIFDESRFIGNRKFRNMLVISAAISVGVKLIAAKIMEDLIFVQLELA
jgi:hypothetical protein